ncbi:flagellar protein FlaG [Natronoarchaeum philippinense]|uniref:Flagellar protein FlaG n=1 Tax=Natronoarchaeum philippinense TaxID=558529 RepID=A0A285N861_NATPI|nr:fla cluster protein flaG [Natronoarchaeum philippinense]SNZ05600.1 flagellar protein FlaG [Natronoarchaeum philippinense]
MASVSVSHLIIFIAALTVSVGVATTLTVNVQSMTASMDERGESVANDIETDVTIISDPGSPASIYDGAGNVTLLVKNTGDRPIDIENDPPDVLIDGRYQPSPTVTIIGDSSTAWGEDDVIRVVVDESLEPGGHRATVRTGSAEATMRFRVN